MKIRSLFLGLLLTATGALSQFLSFSPVPVTDIAEVPDANSLIIITNFMNVPETEELRARVEALQREKEESNQRWDSMTAQNNTLSNMLTGVQQSLETQRNRELVLAEQARAFNARVVMAAGGAIFLVFLASYWFQLRCLNRVMEISREMPQLAAPFAPALLEAANARESRLLEAVKLLEDRIRLLQSPAGEVEVLSNGPSRQNGHSVAADKVIDANPMVPPASPEAPMATQVSVLLAKGEVLLETEQLQEALTTFNEVVSCEPNHAEAHLKKGITLERLNRLEEALSCYNVAVRLNPKRSFAYVHKARVLAALHRYDEALSVYDMALGRPRKANGAEQPAWMFKDAAV